MMSSWICEVVPVVVVTVVKVVTCVAGSYTPLFATY